MVLLLAASIAVSSAGRFVSMDDEFLLRNWDLDDGLPSTHITAVARTADGYVWLATFNGLARFDGMRFVTFNTDNTPALKNNQVETLLVDRSDVLWVGTYDGGLLKRSGAGFETVNLGVAEPSGAVTALAQDALGAIWVGTSGGNLIRLDRAERKVFGKMEGWVSHGVSKLLCDAAGRLWAVSRGKLLTFEAGQWKLPACGLPSGQAVQAVTTSADGGLWVATGSGPVSDVTCGRIFKLTAGRWSSGLENYSCPQDSYRSRVCALFEDRTGRLWCANARSGVFFRSKEGQWQPLTPRAPLAQIETIFLDEDKEGAIWIGTRTAGFYQAQPRLVTTRPMPAAAEQRVLMSVCASRDGSLWGGTEGAGLFRWHGRDVTRIGADQGLSHMQVMALLEDRRTNLWAGTSGGVFRLKEERFERVSKQAALGEATFELLEDARGRLWAGTRTGLVCLDEGRVTIYGEGAGLPSAPVRALAEDREGRIWLALAERGLYRQQGDRFERYRPNAWSAGSPVGEWPGEDAICALHWDAEGSLWLTTRGSGLYQLKNDALKGWDWRLDGLPSNHLLALLEDNSGNLWISSENGIFGLTKKTLESYRRGQSPLKPWRLTPDEGLPLKVCTGMGGQAAAKSADGRLWFADGVDLATFNPASVSHGARTWRPVMEETVVDGVRLAPDKDGVLRVMSGARTFELHFTSPNTLSAERLRFRYRLEGLDKEWFDAGHERVAKFHRLQPGTYQFGVEASGPEEDWQPAASPLLLEVVPRFYERPLVRGAAAVALLAVVAGAVWAIERTRFRRRLERIKLQQAMDHERQRIAADIHDELGAGLTEITLLGDGLSRDARKSPALESVTRDISARARALTRSMDEVVWAINPRNDTLESFLTYLNKFAQEYLSKAGLRCRWDVPLELPEVLLSSEARHHLYLASKEAVHNVVKHAGASEVWIRFELRERSFALEIEDNGKGFDSSAPLARGNGLANMRRRLEELGGQWQVESFPGKGACVRFVMACPPPADSYL